MKTELTGEDFIRYQFYVKRFLDNYNKELCSGLKRAGFVPRHYSNFVYAIGKKEDKIISLGKKCRRISYGNIMDFYELFPYEVEERDLASSESKVERTLERICDKELVEFAFENNLSFNIWTREKFALAEDDSIFMPIKAVTDCSNGYIIQRVSSLIKPKMSVAEKIKSFFGKHSTETASIEPYFHLD